MNLSFSRRRCAALAIAAAVAACKSPDPNLYTIAPIPGTPAPALARGGAPKIVMLRGIGLARYLERNQIVRSSENYRLDVLANDWWGEPLGAMLGRVLVEELNQRLPGSSVFSETGAVTTPADATVEINIQRLDADASGNVVLLAQAGVTLKRQANPVTRSFRFVVPPSGSGAGAEVAAISAAVGQLADGLAEMLRGG